MTLTRASFSIFIGFLLFCAFMGWYTFVPVDVPQVNIELPQVTTLDDYGDLYFASHAEERHPVEAVAVRQCLVEKGMHSLWKEANGRFIQVCEIESGKWGMRVCESEQCTIADEITAFIKNKMSRWDQVMQYLQNHGAIRVR